MEKLLLDIHPRNKSVKFQPNPTIFEVSRRSQSFSLVLVKNSSPGPKNQNFEKMKKSPPGIHPWIKCAKFQPNRTIFKVSSLPQSFGDRQTHRYTDRHSQILAQLKLRIDVEKNEILPYILRLTKLKSPIAFSYRLHSFFIRFPKDQT